MDNRFASESISTASNPIHPLDDVAAGASRAGVKAAGVVVDDTAVTPRYVRGFRPERELPMIKRIAIGSLRNKLRLILPGALVLSELHHVCARRFNHATTLDAGRVGFRRSGRRGHRRPGGESPLHHRTGLCSDKQHHAELLRKGGRARKPSAVRRGQRPCRLHHPERFHQPSRPGEPHQRAVQPVQRPVHIRARDGQQRDRYRGHCPGTQTPFIENNNVTITLYSCSSGSPTFNNKTGAQTNRNCTVALGPTPA
jgi:hypothetical protein